MSLVSAVMAAPVSGSRVLSAGAPSAGWLTFATGPVSVPVTLSRTPKLSVKIATTRSGKPTSALVGTKLSPVPTSVHVPGDVSACQVKATESGSKPSGSTIELVNVSVSPSVGVESLMTMSPLAGSSKNAPVTTVWSTNARRSVL